MTEDNVLPMPTPLERLAKSINADLLRRDYGHAEWVDATLNLCKHLAEARVQFSDNIGFGHWCEDNGFGKNVLSHQDRAAAIQMGRNPETAALVLEATERSSLQHIHREEFKLQYVPKPTEDEPTEDELENRFTHVSKTGKIEPPEETPTMETATAEPEKKSRGRPLKAAQADKPKPYRLGWAQAIIDAIGPKYGLVWPTVNGKKTDIEAALGHTIPREFDDPLVVQQFVVEFETIALPVVFPKKQPDAPAQPVFAPSKQEAFDAALRAHKRKLDLEFEHKVQDEISKRLNELVLPSLKTKEAEYNRIIKARKGILTKAEFMLLQRCLHTDTLAQFNLPEDLKKRFDAAFNLLQERKIVLCAEKEMPTPTDSTLPRTAAEMWARRKTKR